MALETGVTYIEDLVDTNPVGATDNVDEGDDHIRNIKTAVQGSFPNLGAAAVTLTAAEINDLPTKTGAETLTNKTLTSPVITTPTINGQSGYGLVMIDDPAELMTASTSTGAWTTIDMSAVYAQAHTDGAKVAKLKIFMQVAGGTSNYAQMFMRKKGTSGANDVQTEVGRIKGNGNVANNIAYVDLELDSNSDFEYYTANSGTPVFYIHLVGYYV